MDITYAKELLRKLADGVNPLTGDVLPAEDSCSQPEIIRALYAVVNMPEKKVANLPKNAGNPWSAEEEQKLIEEYAQGLSRKQMAKIHQRTSGAISERLVRLGVVKERKDVR